MTLAVPSSRRGAFMSLSGCARDLAAGLTSSLGGFVVTKAPAGELVHYNWLGWLAVAAALISVWLARGVRVNETETVISTRFQSVASSRADSRERVFANHNNH